MYLPICWYRFKVYKTAIIFEVTSKFCKSNNAKKAFSEILVSVTHQRPFSCTKSLNIFTTLTVSALVRHCWTHAVLCVYMA